MTMSFPSRLPSIAGCKPTADPQTTLFPEGCPPCRRPRHDCWRPCKDRIADEINRLLPEPYAVSDRRNAAPAPAVSNGPTNLIDFTRDYLVALFFACYDRKGEENGAGWTGGDGCIVLLPANDARIVAAPIGALRTIAQRSVFWEAESGVLPAGAYEILYVPICLKRQLLMYLARCHDICTDTMFPDFLAAVRQVSSRASLEFLWDQVSIANGSG